MPVLKPNDRRLMSCEIKARDDLRVEPFSIDLEHVHGARCALEHVAQRQHLNRAGCDPGLCIMVRLAEMPEDVISVK